MSDYNQLLLDLTAWAENDDAEFEAARPTMVRLAEARIYRDIKVQEFEVVVNGFLTVGVPRFPKPEDLIQPRYMKVVFPSGREKILALRQLEFLTEYWPDPTATSEPVYYAIEKAGSYRVAPTPSTGLAYELGYVGKPEALSVDNPTNWLTDNAYDVLFAAAMCEAARFVIDDRQQGLLSMWEPRYDAAVKAINAVDMRAERDDFRVPFIATENV